MPLRTPTIPGLRRRAGRLLQEVERRVAPPTASEPPVSLPDPPTAPARPLPEGWTEAAIREVMVTFSIDDSPAGSLVPYVEDALWRFLHTYGLVRDDRGRALELGSNPYFITWLLEEFTELDVTSANYFSGPARQDKQERGWRQGGEERRRTTTYDHFNMEEDRFPYEDGTFDVVLFCEIIEHLLMDPLAPLREIHRVLRPDGVLVLTTPNVARLGNVLTLVEGGNLYDPYSGYGPYGRHNREYNLHELVKLVTFAGFEVDAAFTADAHPEDHRARPAYAAVLPLVLPRANDLGQYLFVRARKRGEGRAGLPSALYRSYGPGELTDW